MYTRNGEALTGSEDGMQDAVICAVRYAETDRGQEAGERHKHVYAYIGQRIRERRKLLRMNQSQLADLVGFSYQQMQKYESGASQISVSRLLQFARILNVSPEYFYQGINLDDAIGKAVQNDVIQATRTNPLNVLLVDDGAGDLLFKKAISLCSEQVRLCALHDVDVVIDFLQNHATKYSRPRPDIIVMEMMLSGSSGMQLLKSIKRSPAIADIPVIFLTNSISRKAMQEAYAAGVSGFIQKHKEVEVYNQSVEQMVYYWSKVVVLPQM